MNSKELGDKILSFLDTYFLTDIRKDRQLYYDLTDEDFAEYPLCYCGYVLNLMMDGNFQKVNEILSFMPDDSVLKAGLIIINPKVNCREIIKNAAFLKENNLSIGRATLTAGRPYLLNGFNDFSRIGPFLQRKKTSLRNIFSFYMVPNVRIRFITYVLLNIFISRTNISIQKCLLQKRLNLLMS